MFSPEREGSKALRVDPVCYSMGVGVMSTTDLLLLPRWRMCGAILSVP